jgi:uncharacterized protein YndB with AHSA1/START domain
MIYRLLGSIVLILALCVFVARQIHTSVQMERTFEAPVERLWKVWNDADSIKKWWGPKNYTATIIQNNVRVGGMYLWGMKSADGKMSWNTGTYKEVMPNRKIVCTLSFSDENGKVIRGSEVPVPGQWPNEVTVITEFSESDGKTKVTVTEVGIPLIVSLLSKIAWAQQFDKIQLLL